MMSEMILYLRISVLATGTWRFGLPRVQERWHPSQPHTRGLDGADQCVVTARPSSRRLLRSSGL